MKKWQIALLTIVATGIVAFLVLRSKPANGDMKVIAIANLMSHPVIDVAIENLLAELKREGYEDGKTVRIISRNANGQMQAVAAIANELAAQNPDIIIPITTPMSQAVKKVFPGPIAFGVVTDPVGAGLVASLERGEEMITGASDAVPYDEQLRLIRRILPDIKRLGILLNPGEPGSQYGIKEFRKYAPEFGFTLVEGPVSSTGDVYPVAQDLSSKVDAMLISTDNTTVAGIAGAVKVAIEHKVPLFACDSGSAEKGAIAAVSAGYAQVGIDTAKLAVRMLKGERNIPPVMAKTSEIHLNRKAAEMMGIVIPDDVVRDATKVYDGIKE